MIWATWRALLTVLTVLGISITCGCTSLIASSGVSDRGELSNPKTRAEVREQFGKPDETRTCPDGRVVESRWIRQQVKKIADPSYRPKVDNEYSDAFLQGAWEGAFLGMYLGSLGLVDIIFVPVMAYRSEKAKLHYAFVYDEAGEVLYLYDLAASPTVQFDEAMRPLVLLLPWQLKGGECESWTACLTDYAQEARRRATCLGYTLCADEEQAFERMFAVGEGVDSGRISREDGLDEIREVLYARPTQ